jgi:hypothetical protein
MAAPGTAKFMGGNARGSEMHQTSTKYCVAVAHLTLMPINLLDHMIARRCDHDDLNVADSLW